MKTLKARVIEALSVLLLLPALAAAAPSLINYQGRLVDTAGNPLVGAQSILFSLYDASSGGTLLWSETQSVTPDNGIFAVSLGSVSSLPASVFSADGIYLEVKIGSDSPLVPRTRLLSVPYAITASNLGSPTSVVTVSTHMVVSASQVRFGNFAALPSALGLGAMVYNTGDNQLYYYKDTGWTALAAGGISPWSSVGGIVSLNTGTDKVTMTSTAADALKVSGGITAGSGSVGIIGTDGKIPALNSSYLASVDGSALTGLNASNLGSGTVPLGRLSGITNTEIAAGAGIAYSKLDLAGSVTSSDVNFNYAASDSQGGAANAIKSGSYLGDVRVSSAVYAESVAANTIDSSKIVDGSVAAGDVAFNYAASDSQGGPANAIKTGSYMNDVRVSSAAYAESVAADTVDSSKIVDGSVAAGDVAFNYAASDSQGGPANAIKTGSYMNDVVVSSAAYADLAVVAGNLIGVHSNPSWLTSVGIEKINLSTITAILAEVATDTNTLADAVSLRIPSADKGAANGVAPLDPSGLIFDSDLSSNVSLLGQTIGNAELEAGAVTKAKISADSCTDGQILKLSGGAWTCGTDTAGAGAMITKEGGTQVVAETSALDFDGDQFNVTDNPTGEGNISIDPSSATLQGNTFNAAGKLLLLDGSGYVADGNISAAITRDAELSAHTGNTSNPHGVTKTQVGLDNVDNTSDANKPVSSAQQSALDLKAPLASPAFTGAVSMSGAEGLSVTYGIMAATVTLTGGITASSATLTGDAEVRGVIKAGSSGIQITNAAGNLDATKLTGSVPQTVTMFSSDNCDGIIPAAVGQFCYDTVTKRISISTSTEMGGYASLALGATGTGGW